MRYDEHMTVEAERVLEAALQLPKSERERLVEALENSLGEGTPGEIEAAWISEAKRRIADVQSGATTPVSSQSTRQRMAEVLDRAAARRAG